MTEKELIAKADTTLADLINNGGYMQPEQADTFFRKLIDTPTILRDCRTIRMRKPDMNINKIGFGTRMLRAAANSSTQGGNAAIGARALSSGNRYKPTFSKISMSASEIIAEINLPYEVLEDNIEGGSIDANKFQETILALMAQQAAMDIEELLISGDTSSGDAYLALQDGVLKRSTSNVHNQNSAPIDADMFASAIKMLPAKYHRLLGEYKFYMHNNKEIDYRMQVAQRQTSLGDSVLTGNAPVSALGVPLVRASSMPTASGLLLVPRNLLFGLYREIRMEFDKNIQERVMIIVMTLRCATQIEEEDMVVKISNIG